MQKMHPVLLLISILLSSCASAPLERDNTEFLTRITDSGLKHFEIRIKRNSQQEQRTSEDQRASPSHRRRERRANTDKVKDALVYAANEHLATNSYCSTGFWVIETNAYPPNLSLRGECNELASEADKTRYPDTIKIW